MDGCQRRESLRCGKMSDERFSVQIEKSVEVGKKPKSVCIFDKQENKVYMLTLFTRLDSKKSVKEYIDNLFEIVDLLNELVE